MRVTDSYFDASSLPPDAADLYGAEKRYAALEPVTTEFVQAFNSDTTAMSYRHSESSPFTSVLKRLGVVAGSHVVSLLDERGLSRVALAPQSADISMRLTTAYDIVENTSSGEGSAPTTWVTSFVSLGQEQRPPAAYGILWTPYGGSQSEAEYKKRITARQVERSFLGHLVVPDVAPDAPFTACIPNPGYGPDADDGDHHRLARMVVLGADISAELIHTEMSRYLESVKQRSKPL